MKRIARTQVKRWLREHKWTQERVATHLGMRQGNFSSMLNGRQAVPLRHAVKMSELMGIPAEDLVSDAKTLELAKSYVTRQNREAGNAR